MPAGRNQDAFVNSFMQGFSFVDRINANKRAEKRLETRLAEERKERTFQNARQRRSDQRLETLYGDQREDRQIRIEDERLGDEGDSFIQQNPNATPEELQRFGNKSKLVNEHIARLQQTGRITGALNDVRGIPRGGFSAAGVGTQSPSNGVPGAAATPDQGAAALAPAQRGVNDPSLPSMTPAERAIHDEILAEERAKPGFQFAPTRGPEALQEVDVDEFNRFNPAYKEKGLIGKIGADVAGIGSQLFRGGQDIGEAIVNIPRQIGHAVAPGYVDPATSTEASNEFAGTLSVPADRYTSPEEFEALVEAGAPPKQINDALKANEELALEMTRIGNQPQSFKLSQPSTQHGALMEASDNFRAEAERAQFQAEKRAAEFLDPTNNSLMDQLAESDPRAAAAMYLQDRATLTSDTQAKMDARMLPIMDIVETEMQANTANVHPNSMSGRKGRTELLNIQNSRNQIAANQPSINRIADIKPAGVKVGDQLRAESVVEAIWDPARPVPSANTAGAVNSAVTVASRISPNKRINAAQTQALAVLAEAGWVDKPTAMAVMMTGHWPPGKNPSGIRDIQAANGVTYALTNDDNVIVLADAKGKRAGAVPDREFNEDRLDEIAKGIASQYPGMDEADVNALANTVYTDPAYYRTMYNTQSEEQMRLLGVHLAETKAIRGAAFRDALDGPLWFEGNTKDVPTIHQYMNDPAMRARVATDFKIDYTPMPDVKDQTGLNEVEIRADLREGRAGPIAADNWDQYTLEEAMTVWGKNYYMEMAYAGRLQSNADGTFTILPEPEAP